MKLSNMMNYVGIFSSVILLITGIVETNYLLILCAVLLFLISINDIKKNTLK